MSARTRKNSASPPTRSNVSGEVAWSRERLAAAGAASFTRSFLVLALILGRGFGLAVTRV